MLKLIAINFSLFFVLAAAFASASITCIEALEKVRVYIEPDESAVNVFEQPLRFNLKDYCIISYPSTIKDSRNFFAVDSFSEGIVEDEQLLNNIFKLSFKYDVLQRASAERWIPVSDVVDFGQQLVLKLNEVRDKRDFLKVDLNEKYSKDNYPSFSKVDAAFSSFDGRMKKFVLDFDNLDLQAGKFSSDFSSDSLEKWFASFNTTLLDMAEIATLVERFQSSLEEFKIGLNNFKNLTAEDKQVIRSNIDALKLVGDANVISFEFKSQVDISLKKLDFFASRFSRFASDSVQFFKFRKSRKDALNAFNELALHPTKNVDILMSPQRRLDYKQCLNIKDSDIQRILFGWRELKILMDSTNLNAKTEDYVQVPKKVSVLTAQVDDFIKKFSECDVGRIQGTSTVTRREAEADYLVPIIAGLILVLIGLEIYRRIKKQQEEGGEESESVRKIKSMPLYK